MRTHIVTCIAGGLISLAGLALAQQEDSAGCKDHPMFTRMPNYLITSCQDQEFSSFDLATRLTTAGLGNTQPVGDNKTDDGRASNRRVVLVKKS